MTTSNNRNDERPLAMPNPLEFIDTAQRVAAARNIKADVELIRLDQINQAFNCVINKDIRCRFVIDMKAARA